MHLASTTFESSEYKIFVQEFEENLEKLRITFTNVNSAIQTEESLLHQMNEKYKKELEELNEKKKRCQDTIAQQKRSISQVEQKLPHKKDLTLENRLALAQEETKKLVEIKQAALAKRNELSQRVRQRKQEESNKILIEKHNELLNQVELNAYRHALQLEIINGNDGIKFQFKCINKKAPEKIYSLFLTISETDVYSVIECMPDSVLPQILQKLEILNEDRELFAFIKRVREIFQEYTKA